MNRETSSLHHPAEWGVHRCECGHFTLKLGALRLDLSPEEFARLVQLMQKAAAHFEIVERSEEPTEARATTH